MLLYIFSKSMVTALLKLIGHFKVVGREQVPRRGGVVLAANHTSYMDPPLVGCAAPRPVHFMAKSELFTHPRFSALIRALGAFPVRRAGTDRQALRTAHELLTAGEAVVIFIEGSRSADGKLQPPELGYGDDCPARGGADCAGRVDQQRSAVAARQHTPALVACDGGVR